MGRVFLILLFFEVILFAAESGAAPTRSGGGLLGLSSDRTSPSAGQKQVQKAAARWTLADWLDTKKTMSNQDMWLASKRKPVSTEFFLGGDYTQYSKETTSSGSTTELKADITRFSFGAFTSVVGLSGQYLNFSNQSYGWDGTFSLRIFGNSIQNTNFTLLYGARTRIDNSVSPAETFRNQYYGTSIAIYIAKQFGIEGLYYTMVPQKSDLGTDLTGSNVEGTIFIDYKLIRIQGIWFKETLERTASNGAVTNTISTGVLAGAKVYF